MLRWTFHIFTALSLLLFVTTIVFWARSYWRWDQVLLTTDRTSFNQRQFIGSTAGTVYIASVRKPIRNYAHDTSIQWNTDTANDDFAKHIDDGFRTDSLHFFGIGVRFVPVDSTGFGYWHARIPYPWLALLFGILPAAWRLWYVPHARSQRRSQQNLCVACGYNLTSAGETCPECGEITVTDPTLKKALQDARNNGNGGPQVLSLANSNLPALPNSIRILTNLAWLILRDNHLAVLPPGNRRTNKSDTPGLARQSNDLRTN